MLYTSLAHFPPFGHLYNLPFLFLLLKIRKCAAKFSFFSLEPLSMLGPLHLSETPFLWLDSMTEGPIKSELEARGWVISPYGLATRRIGELEELCEMASSRNQLLLALAGLQEYCLLSIADPSLLALCPLCTPRSHW